jgi:hypothetical protein
METKKLQRINETKSWFFEKIKKQWLILSQTDHRRENKQINKG